MGRGCLMPDASTQSATETTNSVLAGLEAKWAAQHAEQIAQGLHDDQCEYGKRTTGGSVLMLCHCSKRKREAAGFTVAPSEELEFPPPRCTHCDAELWFDADNWRCDPCSLSWASNGCGGACFTDDYGSIAVAE